MLKKYALYRPYFGRYRETVMAHTKGEARAKFKLLLKEKKRLPIGYDVVETVE